MVYIQKNSTRVDSWGIVYCTQETNEVVTAERWFADLF